MTPPALEALLADAIRESVFASWNPEDAAQACLSTLAEHGYRIVGPVVCAPNSLEQGLRDTARWIQARDPLATNYLYCLQAADALVVGPAGEQRQQDREAFMDCYQFGSTAAAVPPVEEGEVEAVQVLADLVERHAMQNADDAEYVQIVCEPARAAIAALSASRASEPPANLRHRILAFLGRPCNVDECFDALSIAAELGEPVEAVEIAANSMLSPRGPIEASLEAAENGADKRFYQITLRGELRLKEMGGADGEARNAALEDGVTAQTLRNMAFAAGVHCGLEKAAEWHEQRRRDTPDAFEMEFHEVSAAAIRNLKSPPKEQQ